MAKKLIPIFGGWKTYFSLMSEKQIGKLVRSHSTIFRIGHVKYQLDDLNFYFVIAKAKGEEYRVSKAFTTREEAFKALNEITK